MKSCDGGVFQALNSLLKTEQNTPSVLCAHDPDGAGFEMANRLQNP